MSGGSGYIEFANGRNRANVASHTTRKCDRTWEVRLLLPGKAANLSGKLCPFLTNPRLKILDAGPVTAWQSRHAYA